MGGPGGPGPLALPLRALDLTEEQRTQMRTIMEQHGEEFRGLAERSRTAREALHQAVTAESFDEAAVRTASAALAEVQADEAVLRARVHQAVWNTLTPVQRDKAKTLQADRTRRLDERRERLEERLKQRRGNPAQ
jgi:protein CpxP